ncbi:MAG: hypothetical protein KKB20_08235 [Proteobacteria bacterium]|nr:hypothetical protein [Pseudomonadota bacterium]
MTKDKFIDAILSDVSLLTCDRINALPGGHGSLTIAYLSVANLIVEARLAGKNMALENANAVSTDLDGLIQGCVAAAKEAGAVPSNAALITAVLLYFSGTAPRAGVPAANRKLGAMARMHAGAERCGTVAIPTPKMGNKISGFPAVAALYRAIDKRRITDVDGRFLPLGGACGTSMGHSALGEDWIIPQIALNGAAAATRGMLRAYVGLGAPENPIFSAIFGAAAVAEIIHPDAAVSEDYGKYGEVDSIYLTGLGAAREAGLIPELTIRGTDRKLDMARMVGDLGLILKDAGAPTVVAMNGIYDLLSGFEESGYIMPNAIGAINPPLSHTPLSFLLTAMTLLIQSGGDVKEVGERITRLRVADSHDPETALVAMYIVVRKALESTSGPVTDALLAASEAAAIQAVAGRIKRSGERLEAGEDLAQVVKGFDDERKSIVEKNATAFFKHITGKDITIEFTAVRPQARRTDPFTRKYLGFDAYFDADVVVDGKLHRIEDVYGTALPRAARGGIFRLKQRIKGWMAIQMAKRGRLPNVMAGQEWLLPQMLDIPLSVACLAGQELTYASINILNIVVPAAVAVDMKLYKPDEAARIAERAAYITATIPGGLMRARRLGEKILGLATSPEETIMEHP